ncbi:hypothetical protein NE865_15879 [Phthorimaea operculella]|nr:hypothetical protein NE865_15879 [Phthorimaea operculella]
MDIFDGWIDDNSPLPAYSTLLARAIQKSQNISSTTSLPQSSPKDRRDLTAQILSKSNMARALKESGYESDSTLVFRRRAEEGGSAPLSPAERRAAYRDLQAGGEPPLGGFRSPAPMRNDESEIEYIPISPTLTKIRVHKKTPKHHEVICYPATHVDRDLKPKFKKQIPSFITVDVHDSAIDYPPAPPRRISSKNSRTLRLVTNTRPASASPKRTITHSQSNVDFLKNKISNKLTRQNTHIITKRGSIPDIQSANKSTKPRVMSVSAPPAVNRKNLASSPKVKAKTNPDTKPGTSSFGSPRRTILPTEYNSARTKYGESHPSVVIEGGAGRRTPISNILDKVTSLDKLWSAEKRNERIDLSKVKSKSASRTSSLSTSKANVTKSSTTHTVKASSPGATHKSRDMTRTAEKVQKLKVSSVHAKSNPCLITKADIKSKLGSLQKTSNISKSSSNILATAKKPNQVKTAVVTNLKKKKSLDSVIIRPRSVPCHEACSKKAKETTKTSKKAPYIKTTKKITPKCSNDSESGSQFGDTSNEASNFGSFENLGRRPITSKEIKRTHDAIVSDSFFQHLFLGNHTLPSVCYSMVEPNTTVMQKARMFQSYPQENTAPKSLNSYLIHRKPVTLSRFKMWDRYPSPVRSQSPRSVSWPGRIHKEIRKFDSLLTCDEFGSTSSLATVRSRSEPPVNKMYFSQTSRPKSPTVVFHKKRRESPAKKEPSPARIVFSQTSRPVSPVVTRKVKNLTTPPRREKSKSPQRIVFSETVRPISPVVTRRYVPDLEVIDIKPDEDKPTTMFFSQTSRPVSPKVIKKSPATSRSKSTSPAPVAVRSPSYRRIHSAKHTKNQRDAINKCIMRTRSAGDADKKAPENSLQKTKSDSHICIEDPDYEEYIRDMENTQTRSERFRELNRYYAYLERVGELEKTTSTSDLRHRRKDEEIIDFDRWKKIRAIERAEEELNNLYYKLKTAQTEKDFLFYPRDVKDFRWNHDRDRGLRIKEKSVEDLKDHFQQIPYYDSLEIENMPSKDTYKPLWRGTSVSETAFNINRKNENDKNDTRPIVKPVVTLHQDSSLSELRKKLGLGSRLWSSLSMEQVNALKNQLNAIYSKELEAKINKDNEKYVVDVPDVDKKAYTPTLHVRSNSLISPPVSPIPEKELTKSESIAAISCPITSVKELKNNVNKIQMSLSENEKRKISQTISKEVLDRIHKFDHAIPLTLTQEIENSQNKKKILQDKKESSPQISKESSVEKCLEIERNNLKDDIPKPPICLSDKSDVQYQSSASETETGSSDVSNKTVIYRGPKKEVQKKVEYFESVKNSLTPSPVVYHARESSDEKENEEKSVPKSTSSKDKDPEPPKPQISQSQSCSNFKELFGETEKNKFLSLPLKPDLRSRSASPQSEVYVSRTPERGTPRCSSEESVWRSRSPSPDAERYWRAYLNLARAGEVRRLARRFDSPTAAAAVLRRHRSDPELAHNKWSTDVNARRDRARCIPPVARVPLRSTNRYMPHIDIISKLASLRRRSAPRSRSAEEAPECRSGEVERIRRRFEAMSILGQIYASAPDVSELRDIAPYLAGPWIAHRYPKPSDNNRSLTDPGTLVRGRISPVKKEVKRIGGKITKNPVKLSSILKSDVFDAALHRPKNLLYEDVDSKEDSAYFSKEGSPNESVSKSDTESVKSNDSYQTKRPVPHDAGITEYVKSYESEHGLLLSKVNRPKSHEPKSDANNVNNYGTEHVQNGNITERDTKNESDCKVYPKESWPDKYRRNSDFISTKYSEVNKTKRSMSQGVTLEEYLKNYPLNKNYEFKSKSFVPSYGRVVSTTKETKPSFENNAKHFAVPPKDKSMTKNIELESKKKTEPLYENIPVPNNGSATFIRPESKQTTEQKHKYISDINNHFLNTERRVEKENNESKLNLDQGNNGFNKTPEVKDNALNTRIDKYSEANPTKKPSIINGTHNFGQDISPKCIDSNACLTTPPRYIPQEATITITKIVMAYDPDNKDLIYTNKQSLNLPNNDPEKINNNQPETRLPSPVPLPRSSSLRRDYRPNVPKRTHSNDNESYEQIAKYEVNNARNNQSFQTTYSIPIKSHDTAREIVSSYGKKYDSDHTGHVEQTDDYKSMQLREKPIVAKIYDIKQEPKYSSEPLPALKNATVSASLTNLSKQTNPHDVSEDKVPLREKSAQSARLEDHRHTLHDFSGWVNRTNKYPDVYAPMPYSE